MSYKTAMVVTLAEMQDFYKSHKIGPIIELMNQTNDILNDVKWMEANQSDGHLTRIRTGLPEVYWRRLYQGTPPSKSQWAQVKEACGSLEALMELDIEETVLYGDKAKTFRVSEGRAFTEAMRQKVAKTIFYGDSNINPDEFNGLLMRYPSKNTPNVINAGATGATTKCTSMWLISWSDTSVHGIFPKGSTGGIGSEDLGPYMTTDEQNRKLQVVGDKYNWKCGIAVRDWRAVVRIGGIDSSKLSLRKDEPGFVDLQKLTIMAKNMMPETLRQKAIWYCPSEVMTALELQNSDAGNVHLVYDEYFKSKAVPFIHGLPVRQCDAISLEEKILA